MENSATQPLSPNTAEFISRHTENFDGLPLGFMPVIIVVVIAIICIVGWFIAKRELGDD